MAISLGNSMLGGAAEGRLAAEPSYALDSFCQALLALPDSPQPLAQPEAVIAGLQIAREAARDRRPPGNGFWTFTFEPTGGSGGQLTLRRDAAALETGFQVDGAGALHGGFYLSFNGQQQGFDLVKSAAGWVLRKWQGDRQPEFSFPADAAVPWNADPEAGVDGGLGAAGEGPQSPLDADPPPVAEIQWHYLRDGATQGPVAEDALRTLLAALPPDTLVWNPGLPDWKSAQELGLAVTPSPIEPSPPEPSPLEPSPLEPSPPAAAPAGWELATLAGPAAGQRYSVAARSRVGSGEDCDVRLPDPSTAPVHALLMEMPDGYWIADNHTLAGTFVNNARLQKPMLLAPGDVIGIGDTDLVFRQAV
jgi:hypothetical protein